MNRIFYGDNLPILTSMKDESVDLIYIDPPFNTGKIQKRRTLQTVRSENGDRKGFNGKSYETLELGTKAYQDSFSFYTSDKTLQEDISPHTANAYHTIARFGSIYFIEGFLRPRMREAYRILKPSGCLYFHIDYREVHYCKLLLDDIFGRDAFLNEIIWAYDFGGRAKSRWPAKHDNILFYVKDKSNYIFNTSEIDRERYMAPGLVGPEKAELGKLPTDTWWSDYVGKRVTDTWWQTIVGTSSKEKRGYPTQKPIKLINRIIKASTMPGHVVLDFFAGSGTVGESCIINKRNFILIDNNIEALEVMAQRFSGINNIEWINFDPSPFQNRNTNINIITDNSPSKSTYSTKDKISYEFVELASTASYLQRDLEAMSDLWKDSPFEWVLQLPPRSKGKLARELLMSWCTKNGLDPRKQTETSEALVINNKTYAIKFSMLWKNGNYQFQQIKSDGPEYILCFGISPFTAHCWVFERGYAIKHGKKQHKGGNKAEYWVAINPSRIPDWAQEHGGELDKALQIIKSYSK
jgi:site-specific DNA-methyltransferase (adenine-specific)